MERRHGSGGPSSIDDLIAALGEQQSPLSSFGTPLLVDTEVTKEIVHRGKTAVPALVLALNSNDSKVVAYAAYCLGLIGEISVLSALQHVFEQYAGREPKGQFDFAAIGALQQAKDRLREAGRALDR